VKENAVRILEIPPGSYSDDKTTTSTDELEYQPLKPRILFFLNFLTTCIFT
jgi:hypothetical protein